MKNGRTVKTYHQVFCFAVSVDVEQENTIVYDVKFT